MFSDAQQIILPPPCFQGHLTMCEDILDCDNQEGWESGLLTEGWWYLVDREQDTVYNAKNIYNEESFGINGSIVGKLGLF